MRERETERERGMVERRQKPQRKEARTERTQEGMDLANHLVWDVCFKVPSKLAVLLDRDAAAREGVLVHLRTRQRLLTEAAWKWHVRGSEDFRSRPRGALAA
eukprot:388165-Pleurochrysis_carterae.AAC.2